jgi:hypothetical protein
MITRYYRLTVIGCALSWLLVGLHPPALQELLVGLFASGVGTGAGVVAALTGRAREARA